MGGVLYLSYNSTPGWSPAMPLRHLMTPHAELAGSEDTCPDLQAAAQMIAEHKL